MDRWQTGFLGDKRVQNHHGSIAAPPPWVGRHLNKGLRAGAEMCGKEGVRIKKKAIRAGHKRAWRSNSQRQLADGNEGGQNLT